MKEKLSNLIEFGADQGNVKRTVFYNIEKNKLFVGDSVPFPIIYLPSAGLSYAVYVFSEMLVIQGLFPLLLSFLLMLLLALYQFKSRREKTVVEIEPYEIPQDYFAVQRSNGIKTYAIILLFALLTAGFCWLYFLFSHFMTLFLAFSMWYFFLLLLLTGQFKKTKYLKVLEGR
ncbi:hypothetical protein ACVRXQ_08970 [Streptococcus panodentis]|uniref:hypothetical protein n=1 Tax=Streptococcus TaxID=1301 RepID=UPI00079861E0|nr:MULTISPECIES: hypothetical protein [Streptococcus]KXT77437.1 hypothetical protein STRDD11_02621 [Streptococcus sp. DD11]